MFHTSLSFAAMFSQPVFPSAFYPSLIMYCQIIMMNGGGCATYVGEGGGGEEVGTAKEGNTKFKIKMSQLICLTFHILY